MVLKEELSREAVAIGISEGPSGQVQGDQKKSDDPESEETADNVGSDSDEEFEGDIQVR